MHIENKSKRKKGGKVMLLADVFPLIKDNEIVFLYCNGKRIKNPIMRMGREVKSISHTLFGIKIELK